MMMKKKVLAVLCLAFLLLSLFPLSSLAAEDPYFIAVNDDLPELSLETQPIRVGGVTYIPCMIFDRRNSGSVLGVFYAWDVKGEKVSIYSKSQTLEFDIKNGTAFSYDKQKEYNYQAVTQNGMAYVPAASTCKYFGLDLSFPISDDAKVQILRIKNGNQVLDDQMFLRSARPLLEDRNSNYNQGSGGSSTGGKQTGGGTITIRPNESRPTEEGKDTSLYLAIRVGDAANLSSILTALEESRQLKAVFFFRVDQLMPQDDLLREVIGRGHRVGFIPSGDSTEAQIENLQEGNRLLKHILRQKAVFVLQEGGSGELGSVLRAEGYLPWTPNISVSGAGRSDSATYQTVLQRLEKKTGKARLLLDDKVKGGTLSSVLKMLEKDGYNMRALRETDY